MHRRAFMAGAACAFPFAAVGAVVSSQVKAKPAYHCIDFTDFGDRSKIEKWSGSIEHWMTPKGEVWVTRWPSMTNAELLAKVRYSERQIYG